MASVLEETLYWQIRMAGLPMPECEYCFDARPIPRKWRADFAWVEARLLVEVEGGTWVDGRHGRGQGMQDDMDKYNQAAMQGWTVLRFTGHDVDSGGALNDIETVLKLKGVMA